MSGWSGTWKDILNGGSPRWKITCEESHEKAYSHFQRHVLNSNNNDDANAEDIQIAWENLEAARTIVEKMLSLATTKASTLSESDVTKLQL